MLAGPDAILGPTTACAAALLPLAEAHGRLYAKPLQLANEWRPFVGLWPAADLETTNPGSETGSSQAAAAVGSSAGVPEGASPEFDQSADLEYNPHLAHSPRAGRDVGQLPIGGASWLQYKQLLQLQQQARLKCSKAGAGVYCRCIPVVLSYGTGEMGLCNQVYTHIAAWALAAQLGADVLVPPAVKRKSFDKNSGYQNMPFEGLFSWPHTQELLQGLGLHARLYPRLDTWTDKLFADTAAFLLQEFASGAQPGGPAGEEGEGPRQLLRPSGQRDMVLPLKMRAAKRLRDLEGLAVAAVMQAVANATAVAPGTPKTATSSSSSFHGSTGTPSGRGEAAAGSGAVREAPLPCAAVPLVHLHLTKPLFVLRTRGDALAAHIASRLRFAYPIEQRAQQVLQAMCARNITRYHAIHLRVEGDQPFTKHMGGLQGALQLYLQAAASIGLGAPGAERLPIYVASGLSSYAGGEQLWRQAKETLVPLGSEIITKEDLLLQQQQQQRQQRRAAETDAPPLEPGDLNPEQQAAVDVLVLERASLFIGFGCSSMSFFVQQRRRLAGMPQNASALVEPLMGALKAGAVIVP